MQNKAARLIKKTPLRDRITPALIELHWLPIKARIEYKICLLTYKALKYKEPKYLNECLAPFKLETNIMIRHATERHRLLEPRGNRNIAERSFDYCAPRIYNKLPLVIKDNEIVGQFKKRLKTHLFEKTYR